jgi:signal transduction histidine kinase
MRLLPTGLRGRLLLALVLTAALTLGATATIVLGPLRERLRVQSVKNLRTAVTAAQPEFQSALRTDETAVREAASRGSETFREFQTAVAPLSLASSTAAYGLTERTGDVRVVVMSTVVAPWPIYDTDTSAPTQAITLAALDAQADQKIVTMVQGDDVTIGVPLNGEHGVIGALVVARRLSEVATAVEQVRNALMVGALVGLAVAIALAIGLSRTLTRRLKRLRNAALRVTEEGFAAPAPRDSGRDEVGDLARALARMQEELRRQEAARRSFVATASHELRTPLTMLQGTMELLEEDLRDGGDLDDAHEQVTSARRELLRLSALAGELLDLSRLDAAVQLRSEPVELGELARAVAAEFELRARERDVVIDVVPPTEACWGRGDPDAVARVVRILLDNSLRYGPRGAPIHVRALRGEEGASIEVTDRGPGIPEEERERIFERFHRGRAAGSASGFGLGLAIGRELAERMGGHLRLADSRTGARFVLTLPAAAPAQDGRPAPSLSAAP